MRERSLALEARDHLLRLVTGPRTRVERRDIEIRSTANIDSLEVTSGQRSVELSNGLLWPIEIPKVLLGASHGRIDPAELDAIPVKRAITTRRGQPRLV